MKQTLILILSISLLVSCSQYSKENALEHYKKVYQNSIRYGDYIAAADAIYGEWDLDTANAFSYKDTLANLYFIRRQYVQTVVLGKEILAKKPDDLKLMELIGAADQNINNLTEALLLYQKIYTVNHDLFYLYQIASIQFNLNRTDECNQTIDQILTDPNSANQKIQITVAQGQAQNVSYKAAALNIRGVIAKGLKQNETAKKAFQDALDADPDFALAKGNLADINKSQVGTSAVKK
jgi:tetratricopeptide (TPR) repeat protein